MREEKNVLKSEQNKMTQHILSIWHELKIFAKDP